jgi:signal transduction histidine kinase
LNIKHDEKSVPSLHIRSNVDVLASAFFNIIKNAKEASSTNLEIQVKLSKRKPEHVEFLFFNNGNPITQEELDNCFNAGWSSEEKQLSRADEGNVGMGLYMTSKIVKLHLGKIEIFNLNDIPRDEFKEELQKKFNVCVRITIPITKS